MKNNRKRSGGAFAKATKALREVRKLRREQETKHIIWSEQTITIPAAGAGTFGAVMNAMATGDSSSTRTGEKVTMTKLAMRFNVKAGAEADGCSARIIVLYDRRPAGAVPAVTDILESDHLVSLYTTDRASQGRFQVLADRTFAMQALTAGSERNLKLFVRKTMPVLYEGNAGTIADIQRGSLYTLGVGFGNAQAIVIKYSWNMSFTDS